MMDFKRIMLMLTFFFFIFDVYLIYRVYEQFQLTTVQKSDYQQQNIEQRLADRGITLLSNLENEKKQGFLLKSETDNTLSTKLSTLTNQTVDIDDFGQLSSIFSSPLSLNGLIDQTTNSLTTEVASFIRDHYLLDEQLFISGENYTKFWYLPSTKTIIFWTVAHDGFPIVDGTSEIRLQLNDNYDIASYTQTLQHNFVVLDEEKPYSLISARDAIEVLDTRIQTNLPSNSKIIHVTLSYIKYKHWDEVNVYLPVWNVVYQKSDGPTSSMWVDAIKGQVVERPRQ